MSNSNEAGMNTGVKTGGDTMTGREALENLRREKQKVKLDCMRLAQLKEESMMISGSRTTPNYNPNRQHEANFAPVIEELCDMENTIKKRISDYENRKEYLTQLIRQIPDERYANVLEMTYVLDMTPDEVAKNCNYVRRWVSELHNEGMAEFEKIYNKAS